MRSTKIVITVELLSTASKRTKNRVREHGPKFVFLGRLQKSALFNNQPALLLTCVCSEDKHAEPWVGWLPESEIKYPEYEAVKG